MQRRQENRCGLPGVCIFCDGPDHDQPVRRESEQHERGRLADLGYRILTIRYDSDLDTQRAAHQEYSGSDIKLSEVRLNF